MSENRVFQGVQISFDDHWAHIISDSKLLHYLERKGAKDAAALADYLLKEYQAIYKKPLKISKNSLAIEILLHVYAGRLSKLLQTPGALPPKLRDKLAPALDTISSKAAIIDCGEKAVDHNRFVFDALEPYAYLIIPILDT